MESSPNGFTKDGVQMIGGEVILNESSIKDLVANDIKSFAEEQGRSVQHILKDISAKREVGLRTLQRIVSNNNSFKPLPSTVLEVYSYLYKTTSVAELLTKLRTEIAEYLAKNNACFSKNLVERKISSNPKKEIELTTDSLFNIVYILASGDCGIDVSIIRNMLGKMGLDKLDEMITEGHVQINENEKIVRKNNLVWTVPIIHNFTKTLHNEILKPKEFGINEENYISFFSGKTTKKNAIEAKSIIRDAFRKAVALVSETSSSDEESETICLSSTSYIIETNKEEEL
jgi:hypothetical protein